MAETFPISGSIDPKAFPFLLMDLHRQGATGSLKVDGPSYQKALYFRSGRILFGSSNDPRDQLGAILIESGKITPEQLEEVNAKVGSGNPLAKVLADSGFVSQRELGEAARAKVERILSDVMAYETGSFEFEDGVLPKGAVDLKLSSERLVLAAVRRINDRNFVLRHLASLESVLTPTEALAAAAPEIRAETAGLHEALDGRRTLKQAITHTRLDEFEGAKIACGLMFLGLVSDTDAEPTASPDLDLSQTARMALDDNPPIVMPTESATLIMDSSPLPETPDSESPAATGFAFIEPSSGFPAADAEPIVIDAEGQPSLQEEPTLILPEPLAPFATASTPQPHSVPETPELPRPRPVPAARAHPTIETEAAPPHSAPKRPSKDDLAALDALLNTRTSEGPLAPIEKPPQAWEPRFGHTPVRAARHSRSRLRLPLIAAALVLLVAGAGAAWHYLGLGGPDTKAVASGSARPAISAPPRRLPTQAPPSTPVPTPAPIEESPPDVAAPASSAPASNPPSSPAAMPPTAPPSLAPTPAPPPSTSAAPKALPAPASSGPGTSLAAARSSLRQGRLPQAASEFVTNLRQSPPNSFSIQLLVACSPETVEKALANVSAPDLFILPVNYKGRPCYRVCWGVYESEPRADSAVSSIPEYFRKGGSAPRVVPTSDLLP